MKYCVSLMAGVFACLCTGSALADSTAAPMRHLTYSFSYGATGSVTGHNSGFSGEGGGSGSGISSSRSHDAANGTLTVDVLREQKDKGLVISVSEKSDSGRHMLNPTTCVVWGTTSTICDPNATPSPEVISLVRLLGSNFIDPALVDAKQHWQTSSTSTDSSYVADFTISKTVAGVMTISEDRKVDFTGAHRGNAVANATISYDFNRSVPLSVNEISTGRVQDGGDYRDVKTEISFNLTADSMADKH